MSQDIFIWKMSWLFIFCEIYILFIKFRVIEKLLTELKRIYISKKSN